MWFFSLGLTFIRLYLLLTEEKLTGINNNNGY